ncbi:MAG: ribbon-helix-helix domain-containing protein [Rhodospirillaceae bacterium]|nr:ribbon-helix-helix domain-containing protein [Rhodospirillaceae bacterium]MBT5244597.1 ribbon-helix-helix domain-containing protein [Rhodospirillaceae bacterium]MBT5563507.1 ribbon-helix-helix domain-containing protein [Rhodospirillaceae bacterium]MBT6240762.1 ribbon-helix-helix domain-containing protein [Rhodospirillaceae bacterium]MBT7137768.1 ribbon-helix-helix domain-containing protein [Rhodospirillaceae bacterium]
MSNNHSLVSRNVTIKGHRTSLRMEQETWDALAEICQREDQSIHQVCTQVEERRQVSNRTSAVRAFIITYYRAAATEDGHLDAGHGNRS